MRKPLSLSIMLLILPLLAASHVAAGECTQALSKQMFEEASIIERTSAQCQRLGRPRHFDAVQFCSVCAPMIKRTLKLEQLVRNNQSCFTRRREKREIRRLMSKRGEYEFLARGCGA